MLLFQDPSVHDATQPLHLPVDDGFNPFAHHHQQQLGETPKVHLLHSFLRLYMTVNS